jgi:hypothetical protein
MRLSSVFLAALVPSVLLAQSPSPPPVDVRQLMSASQFDAAGLRKLSDSELGALNTWIAQFAVKLLTASGEGSTPAVIESQIDGEFQGWDGETIFKLVNGQIWQQSSYQYYYYYAYMPKVTIYHTDGGYKMKVDGVDQSIFVKRIR